MTFTSYKKAITKLIKAYKRKYDAFGKERPKKRKKKK